MANEVAQKGTIFVCGACGRQSRDRYGDQKLSSGWDTSCMTHAVLCYEEQKSMPQADGMFEKTWVAVHGKVV